MSDIDPGAVPGAVGGGLTKKVGPLPVWGYGAIAVGGFVAIRFLRGRSSTAAVADPNASIPAAGALTSPASAGTTTLSGQLTDLQGTDSAILAALNHMAGTPAPVVPATPVISPSGNGVSADGFSATVHNIYAELLGRQGGVVDPSGGAFWDAQVAGHNPMDVFLQVENTPEAQQLAANNPQGFINGQYQYALGRPADPGALAFWQADLSQHGAVKESQDFAAAAAKEKAAHP